MTTIDFFRIMERGEGIDSATATLLKYPTLDTASTTVSPTGIAASAYSRHVPGVFRLSRAVLGLPANDQAGSVQKAVVTVTDDTGSSHIAIPIFNFPKGVVQVVSCYGVVGLTTGGGTWTTPHYSVAIGSGTAGACTSSTLTGAFANLIPSTTFTDGTGTLTVAEPLLGTAAITDSSGATASTTWLTIAGTATYASADINRLAVMAAQTAATLNNFTRSKLLTVDGSSTAAVMYLNLGVASSPATLTATFTANSFIDLVYRMSSPQAYANTATTASNAVSPQS